MALTSGLPNDNDNMDAEWARVAEDMMQSTWSPVSVLGALLILLWRSENRPVLEATQAAEEMMNSGFFQFHGDRPKDTVDGAVRRTHLRFPLVEKRSAYHYALRVGTKEELTFAVRERRVCVCSRPPRQRPDTLKCNGLAKACGGFFHPVCFGLQLRPNAVVDGLVCPACLVADDAYQATYSAETVRGHRAMVMSARRRGITPRAFGDRTAVGEQQRYSDGAVPQPRVAVHGPLGRATYSHSTRAQARAADGASWVSQQVPPTATYGRMQPPDVSDSGVATHSVRPHRPISHRVKHTDGALYSAPVLSAMDDIGVLDARRRLREPDVTAVEPFAKRARVAYDDVVPDQRTVPTPVDRLANMAHIWGNPAPTHNGVGGGGVGGRNGSGGAAFPAFTSAPHYDAGYYRPPPEPFDPYGAGPVWGPSPAFGYYQPPMPVPYPQQRPYGFQDGYSDVGPDSYPDSSPWTAARPPAVPPSVYVPRPPLQGYGLEYGAPLGGRTYSRESPQYGLRGSHDDATPQRQLVSPAAGVGARQRLPEDSSTYRKSGVGGGDAKDAAWATYAKAFADGPTDGMTDGLADGPKTSDHRKGLLRMETTKHLPFDGVPNGLPHTASVEAAKLERGAGGRPVSNESCDGNAYSVSANEGP